MDRNDIIIELIDVNKKFDDGDSFAVENFNLSVKRGQFVTFLGPSGCGKTTTLRMIAGFEIPTSGKILLNGEDIAQLPPYKRPVNTVFQRYALFPHLDVYDNIAFGLKLKKVKTIFNTCPVRNFCTREWSPMRCNKSPISFVSKNDIGNFNNLIKKSLTNEMFIRMEI